MKIFSRLGVRYAWFIRAQLLHIILFMVISGKTVEPWLLILSGMICILLYGRMVLLEVKSGLDLISPFLFYLIASVVRLGVGTIYVASVVLQGETQAILVGPVDTSDWLMGGHRILMMGDWFFISGYLLFLQTLKKNVSVATIGKLFQGVTVYKVGLTLALLGLSLRTVDLFFGSMSGFGQLVGYVSDFGVPAGTYLMLRYVLIYKGRMHSPAAYIALGLLLINILIGFQSYMKSDLFIALLPIILIGIERIRVRWHTRGVASMMRPALGLLILTYIFVFTVSTYSEQRRKDFWFAADNIRGTVTMGAGEVEVWRYLKPALIGSVPGTEEFGKSHKFPRSGAWQIVKRFSVTQIGAWAYARVALYGTWEHNFFKDLLVSVTPRIFWPDKPQVWPGRLFAVELGQALSAETATTSTALTMAGSYYWWGGYVGLCAGMFVSGAGLALVWSYMRTKWEYNPVATLVAFILLFKSLHWFEGSFFGAFPLYLYVLIVFVPLTIVVEKILRRRESLS